MGISTFKCYSKTNHSTVQYYKCKTLPPQCSVTCGRGTQGRQVICRPEGYESLSNPPILPDSQCDASARPISQQPCNMPTCQQMTTPQSGLGNLCFRLIILRFHGYSNFFFLFLFCFVFVFVFVFVFFFCFVTFCFCLFCFVVLLFVLFCFVLFLSYFSHCKTVQELGGLMFLCTSQTIYHYDQTPVKIQETSRSMITLM